MVGYLWRWGGYEMSQYVCRVRSGKRSREGKETWLFKRSILYYLKIDDETVVMNHCIVRK